MGKIKSLMSHRYASMWNVDTSAYGEAAIQTALDTQISQMKTWRLALMDERLAISFAYGIVMLAASGGVW